MVFTYFSGNLLLLGHDENANPGWSGNDSNVFKGTLGGLATGSNHLVPGQGEQTGYANKSRLPVRQPQPVTTAPLFQYDSPYGRPPLTREQTKQAYARMFGLDPSTLHTDKLEIDRPDEWKPFGGIEGGILESARTQSQDPSAGRSVSEYTQGFGGRDVKFPEYTELANKGTKQMDAVVRILGLSEPQRRWLHDEITKNNYTFQEILKIAIDVFGEKGSKGEGGD